VAKIDVVVEFCELAGPRFKFGCVHFNGRPTTSTGEVVMMRVDNAAPVETFATVGHNDVDFVHQREGLQLGVDRRERYTPSVSRDESVEFLGTDEALDTAQHAHDFAALGRIARRTHDSSVPALDLISGMILNSVLGMIPKKTP